MARPLTSLAVMGLLAVCACSAPIGAEDEDTVPDYVGALPSGANTQTPAAPGAGGPSTSSGTVGGGPSGSPSAGGGGEQTQTGGTPISPSTNPNTGNNNGANNGNTNGGGAGGSAMVPNDGNVGAGGSSMATGGTSSTDPVQPPSTDQQPPPVTQPPVTPPPVTQPPVTPPPEPEPPAPTGPDIPCPADATFCSGFEGAVLPDVTNFVVGGDSSFPNQFALDTSQAHSGQQSFMIPGPSPGFSYRALAIPAPGQEFWARLYVQVGTEFGDGNHDSLFGASNADLQSDHNNETLIELSEQFDYMLLNTDDCALACNTPSPQLQLPPNEWHCMEAHYNGNTGQVEIFLDGDRFIDATRAQHQLTFQTFRLGYMRFNTERTVWYDDVVLARSRVGCD